MPGGVDLSPSTVRPGRSTMRHTPPAGRYRPRGGERAAGAHAGRARPARRRVQQRRRPGLGAQPERRRRQPSRGWQPGRRACARPRSASASTASRATPTRCSPRAARSTATGAASRTRPSPSWARSRRPAAACWPGPSSTRCTSRPRRRSWSRPGCTRPSACGRTGCRTMPTRPRGPRTRRATGSGSARGEVPAGGKLSHGFQQAIHACQRLDAAEIRASTLSSLGQDG